MRASSPNATVPSDPLLAGLLVPLRLFLAPCAAPVTSRLVTFSARSGYLAWCSWRPVVYPGFDSCLFQEFAQRCFVVRCLTLLCGAAVVQAHAAMAGGSGVETEMSDCTVLSVALVLLHRVNTCRQPGSPTNSSKRQLARQRPGVWPSKGKGVRTGGRLHPQLAGERLLNNAQLMVLSRRGCLEFVGIAGFEREMTFGTVVGCAPVVLNYDCAGRQPRLPTCSS